MYSGKKIREIRKLKGLTLRDVSAMSGVTESQISQIENNKANPSIATLIQITQALNIPIVGLFGKQVSGDYPVLRENERALLLERAGVKYYLLTNSVRDNMEFLYVEYAEGGKTDENGKLYTHEGVEMGIVLKGKLEVVSGWPQSCQRIERVQW